MVQTPIQPPSVKEVLLGAIRFIIVAAAVRLGSAAQRHSAIEIPTATSPPRSPNASFINHAAGLCCRRRKRSRRCRRASHLSGKVWGGGGSPRPPIARIGPDRVHEESSKLSRFLPEPSAVAPSCANHRQSFAAKHIVFDIIMDEGTSRVAGAEGTEAQARAVMWG